MKTTDDIFKGKKVALFAVPGAFTPTCNKNALPGFLQNADAIKAKGIDTIAVTGVNDVFVMDAWKKATGADGKIEFLADGNGEFAKALDLTFDGSGFGLGTRSKRYAMLVEDGVVKKLNIEEAPGKVEVSAATPAQAALDVTPTLVLALMRLDAVGSPPAWARERGSSASRAPARRRARCRAWPAWPRTQCQRTWCVRQRRFEPLPEVDVLHRLLVGGAPAVALPARDPGMMPSAQILAVGVEIDAARPLERFERGDRGHQLHAVVGGLRLAAFEFLLAIAEGQDRAPAARARIARAGAVGVDDDVRLAHADHGSMPVVARALDRLVEAQLAQIFERILRAAPARPAARRANRPAA